MSPTEAMKIVKAHFPWVRFSDVAKFQMATGGSVQLKKGAVTLTIGITDRAAMFGVEVDVDGATVSLSPLAHDGYDLSTFAARVQRMAKAIDALAALRGGK
jgi:hypothetical protein